MHSISVCWGQGFCLAWLVEAWSFFSPWAGDGEYQMHYNYLVLWSEIWPIEMGLMWLKAVMEASAVCFQIPCSRIWRRRSLICWRCVCHVLIVCRNILSCGTWVTLKDTQFAVYSLGYSLFQLNCFFILTAFTWRKNKTSSMAPPFIWIHVK